MEIRKLIQVPALLRIAAILRFAALDHRAVELTDGSIESLPERQGAWYQVGPGDEASD